MKTIIQTIKTHHIIARSLILILLIFSFWTWFPYLIIAKENTIRFFLPHATDANIETLSIGVISSIIAAVIIIGFQYWYQRREKRLKYGDAAGEYRGYSYVHQTNRINLDDQGSNVSLKYISENTLELTLDECKVDSRWIGLVTMESSNYGSVTWRYVKINGKTVEETQHEFGFKRLMYRKINNNRFIYLLGEDGYGKEILIHKSNMRNLVPLS